MVVLVVVVLRHVLLLIGDQLLLRMLVGKWLHLVVLKLLSLVMQWQLLVLVSGRSFMILGGKGLLVVVVLLMMVLLQLLVQYGGHLLFRVGKRLHMLLLLWWQ
jgi:hypothetical protein